MTGNNGNGTKIIGGMFGLEETTGSPSSKPPFLNGSDILLANGRSGINLLVRLLSPRRVWMPSYLCEVMVKAVTKESVPLDFYPVDGRLSVATYDWLREVKPGDLTVFIDYFGFPFDERCAELAREQGAWVLEDASQALLSDYVGRASDFVLFSPRKFVGVPDGGVLSGRPHPVADRILPWEAALEGSFGRAKLDYPPLEWWKNSLTAGVLRHEFDVRGGGRRWFELFQEAEENAPMGQYKMSEFSRMLLTLNIDYRSMSRRRIENFEVLSRELGEMALFPSLPPGVVPIGFPIKVEDRDRLLQALFAREIYPPVHWPLGAVVPPRFDESHYLSKHIMTLPCDQRYDADDMARICRAIKEVL